MDLRNDQAGYEAGKDPAVGTYTGKFILRVEHDLSDFANDPAKYVESGLMPLLESAFTGGSWNSVDAYTIMPGTAEITRVINGNATVEYTTSGEMSSATYERKEKIDIKANGENIILNFLGGTNTYTASNGYSGSSISPAGGEWPIGWDDNTWKPWESEKTMK
jgi:hypothetical protein